MLQVIRETCPFPTVDGAGTLYDGLNVQQSPHCTRCKEKTCRAHLNSSFTAPTHIHCNRGFSLLAIPTGFGMLLVNGVHVPIYNTELDAATKKKHRAHKVTWEQATGYATSLKTKVPRLLKEIRQQVQDSVAGLHDIKTAVNLLSRNAEGLMRRFKGKDDSEKMEKADPDLRCLLESVNLLKARLELASLIANPESASYGRRRPTPVYKLFDRMVKLFDGEARRHHLKLIMCGESHLKARLHDSFETIPLVLIDNAVKYGTPDTNIIVRVQDLKVSGGCCVSVTSIGPVVPPQYRERIFEPRFRTPKSRETTSAGSGLGLYIGQVVAQANRSTIEYSVEEPSVDGLTGKNIFSFKIKR